MPRRLYLLDIARGIASISVVLWHWQHFSYDGTFPSVVFDRTTQPLYEIFKVIYENGGSRVRFFFVLSGFLFYWFYYEKIKTGKTSLTNFFLARFSRLYPLHFITLLLVAILQSLYWISQQEFFVYPKNDLFHFILNVTLTNHWGTQKGWSFNAPVWFVSIEVLLYLFFFLLAKKNYGRLIYCISLCIISIVTRSYYNHPFFSGVLFFFIGGIAFHLSRTNFFCSKICRFLIHALTFILWSELLIDAFVFPLDEYLKFEIWSGFRLSVNELILFPVTIWSLVLTEIHFYNSSKKINKLKKMAWIGECSYSIYLLHFPLQIVFGLAVVHGLLEKDFYLNTFWLLAFLSVLIFISQFSYRKIELPAKNRIRVLFSKIN